jgi:putative ABC transport system permease protein
MDDELRFHLEMETEANMGRGLSPDEARRAALRDLGGVAQTKEEIRDVRRLPIEWLWHDARLALRSLRRNAGFSAFAIATLALGIGVNTAATAVVYGVLVRPLPYPDASRIVVLNLHFADGGDLGFSPAALQNWLPRLQAFDMAAGYYSRDISIRTGGTSAVIPAAFVTDRFFDVLGVPAESGRARVAIASRLCDSASSVARRIPVTCLPTQSRRDAESVRLRVVPGFSRARSFSRASRRNTS